MSQTDVAALKAFAIEMSRDPREGLTARQRAFMACIVIPSAIQQWMLDAGAVEPLLDSIEKTILAAEEPLRAALQEIANDGTRVLVDSPDMPGARSFTSAAREKAVIQFLISMGITHQFLYGVGAGMAVGCLVRLFEYVVLGH